MLKPTSTLPALAFVAFALFLAGCGGSSDADTLSRAEFIKRADAICDKTDSTQFQKFRAYTQKHAKSLNQLSLAEQEEKLTVVLYAPSVKKELGELKALSIPEGDQQKVQELFAEIDAAVEDFEKDPGAFQRGGSEDPFNKASKMARLYGLDSCQEVV